MQLFSHAFRPFFLLGGVFSAIAIGFWSLIFLGYLPHPPTGNAMFWHAHEMLYGFAVAIVTGFLLTAVSAWTGRPPVSGNTLACLAASWLIGRIAMYGSLRVQATTGSLVGSLDLLFPALLCILAGREILGGRSRRNYGIFAITAFLFLLDLSYHFASATGETVYTRLSLIATVHVILLLITLIAGRIIPAFTRNWLRDRDLLPLPTSSVPLDRLVLTFTLLAGIALTLSATGLWVGLIASVAALLHTLRLLRWCGLATVREPLLFVLHVAYAWIPIGYGLLAAIALGFQYPQSVGLHALTVGAIGTMLLAMISRVALGHTGRALHAARLTVIAYLLLTFAVLSRLAGPFVTGHYTGSIEWAAGAWVLAFSAYTWEYWQILIGPRSDQADN
jgi:uncharacterized protein involved in response to NO